MRFFAIGIAALLAWPAAAATFKLTLLAPADDPRLERTSAEHVWLGHPAGPASDALQLALNDGRFELDAVGAKVELAVVEVADAAAARNAAAAAERAGAVAIVTDLPAAWTLAAADAAPKTTVVNVGDASDALRESQCRRNLFHTLPSERMRSDALAQTLVTRKWSNLLLLTGPSADDQQRAGTVQASIRRYGLKVLTSKPFKLSADPRERDLANPLLLTGPSAGSYDVVWVVDSDGEFASTLPYRTGLPRPVVGDAGLVALAWSSRFERYGSPQLSRSLFKLARRAMTSHDWAAWAAGKALVAAAVAAPKGPAAAFQQAFAKTELDGYKGVPLSFRPWDGQLRQPMLLSDGEAVITLAPPDGLLHPRNVLDTLGADAPEKLCKTRQ